MEIIVTNKYYFKQETISVKPEKTDDSIAKLCNFL